MTDRGPTTNGPQLWCWRVTAEGCWNLEDACREHNTSPGAVTPSARKRTEGRAGRCAGNGVRHGSRNSCAIVRTAVQAPALEPGAEHPASADRHRPAGDPPADFNPLQMYRDAAQRQGYQSPAIEASEVGAAFIEPHLRNIAVNERLVAAN
jgi:hypothetical protein